MKARELAQEYGYTIGCGDNSCQFGSPGGMATNGGCRCLDKHPSYDELFALARKLTAILRRVAEER